MPIHRRGNLWRIASGDLIAEFEPKLGGKLRRLLSNRSGRNFFFADPREKFSRARSDTDYLQHDISGMDECFPTVGKGGANAPDHGVLWNTPWEADKQGDRLITWVRRPGDLPVEMIRTVVPIRPNGLRLEYTLVNLSSKAIPFIYSNHAILSPDTDSRVILPGVSSLKVLGHNLQLKALKTQSWPKAQLRDNRSVRLDTDLTADRKLAGKWFAEGKGSAQITFPATNEALLLQWDQKALPVLGLWLSLGIALHPSAPDPEAWRCLALEPCLIPQDILKADQAPRLHPEKPLKFWIQWTLQTGVKAGKH